MRASLLLVAVLASAQVHAFADYREILEVQVLYVKGTRASAGAQPAVRDDVVLLSTSAQSANSVQAGRFGS